jgi:hypothetical protein
METAPSHPSLGIHIPSAGQAKGLPSVPESGSLSAMPMLKVAQQASLMERTPFAIDNAEDEDEDDDEDLSDSDADDQVLDEVDAFLEAHDSGLSEADKQLANGTFASDIFLMNVKRTCLTCYLPLFPRSLEGRAREVAGLSCLIALSSTALSFLL